MAAIYKSKASMQAYNIEIQEGKTEQPKEKKVVLLKDQER